MRLVLLTLLTIATAMAQVKEFKPSWLNMFSPEQDIQLGKESADEVRKTMTVVNNKELTDYINKIGQRLAKSKRAGNYPYTFEVLNDPSINAFALPGGPMFVHTGLIAAVKNESQLAGVLAHEMSHVSLRHGTTNVSKANLIQLPAMLAGAAAQSKGGLWGALGQLGVGLGAQSILLKYSRGAEKEADLNGAQMMYDAGYDPNEMAKFFDTLSESAGVKKDDSALANFLSDHPTDGKRTQYVADQNKKMAAKKFTEYDPQGLAQAKKIVASLPPPPKKPAQAAAAGGAAVDLNSAHPSGKYRTHNGANYQFNYPDNWEVFGDPNGASITVAPRSTLVQDQQGNTSVGYGFMAAYYFPQDGKVNLSRDTDALLKQMLSSNPSMQATDKAKSVRVAGQNGMLTPFASSSPYQNQRELDMVLTIPHNDALFYLIFIAPEAEWKATQPAFDAVVNSLKFDQ